MNGRGHWSYTVYTTIFQDSKAQEKMVFKGFQKFFSSEHHTDIFLPGFRTKK